jgi:hypothetical protein
MRKGSTHSDVRLTWFWRSCLHLDLKISI